MPRIVMLMKEKDFRVFTRWVFLGPRILANILLLFFCVVKYLLLLPVLSVQLWFFHV